MIEKKTEPGAFSSNFSLRQKSLAQASSLRLGENSIGGTMVLSHSLT